MAGPLQSAQFPQVAQAEAVLEHAIEQYRALQQMARQQASGSALLERLRTLFRETQPLVQQQLQRPILPPQTLARIGTAWEACEREYSDFDFVFQHYDSGLIDGEDIDKAAFIALITDIESCRFNLDAAVRDHRLQQQYWNQQSERRTALEGFLQPDGKEDWVLKTLQDAQRAVADAYFEALKRAREPDYVEAGRLLNQAWRQYREAMAMHEQQAQLSTQLLDTQDIRAMLQRLDETDQRLDEEMVDPDASVETYLSHLQQESRRHRDSLIQHITQHQRALSEDITAPTELACQPAIVALHHLVQHLDDPQAKQELSALLARQKAQLERLEQSMARLSTRHDQAQGAFKTLESRLSKLDGDGFDRRQLTKRWRKLRKIQSTLEVNSQTHSALQSQATGLRKGLEAATTKPLLDAAIAAVGPFLSGPVQELSAHLDTRLETIERWSVLTAEDREACETSLADLQSAVAAAKAKLDARISWYRSNTPPIPTEYADSKQTLLDEIMALGSVNNQQALEAARTRLDTLVQGGATSDFPTPSEAMALFSKAFGTERSYRNWVMDNPVMGLVSSTPEMNREAEQLASRLQTIDMKAMKTSLDAAALDIKTTFPAWDADLKQRYEALVTSVKTQGPLHAEVVKTYTALSKEIRDSQTEACAIKVLKEELDTLHGQLNARLRSQQRNTQSYVGGFIRDVGSLVFAGLSASLEGPDEKLRQKLLKSFTKLKGLDKAKKLTADLTVIKTHFTALLQDNSDSHLLDIQQKAEADRNDAAQKTREAETEWIQLQREFLHERADARQAGASEDDLSSITMVYQTLQQNHSAKTKEQTRNTMNALIRRLKSAAQSPEQRLESAGAALAALQQQWEDEVGEYEQAVTALLTKITQAGVDGDGLVAVQAVQQLTALRGCFSATIFKADLYLVSTQSAVPAEQRIAARERALSNIRSVRRQLEGDPILRLCFVNPFAPLPLSALLSTLNKLELHLVQSS